MNPPPNDNLFDADTFALRVNEKLARDRMSFRKAAPFVPTSSSTLHRVACGGAPDVETYLRVQRWLGQADVPDAS